MTLKNSYKKIPKGEAVAFLVTHIIRITSNEGNAQTIHPHKADKPLFLPEKIQKSNEQERHTKNCQNTTRLKANIWQRFQLIQLRYFSFVRIVMNPIQLGNLENRDIIRFNDLLENGLVKNT